MSLLTPLVIVSLVVTSLASGEVLLQWIPSRGPSPYFSQQQLPPPSVEAFGVTSSPLSRVNISGNFNNAGTSWPGNTNNALGEAGVLDPINGAYTEFTVTPPVDGSITYTSISYQLQSFGGMDNDLGYTGFVRTDGDAFAADLASTTLTNMRTGNFVFDISSLGESATPVTFRLYFVNNNAAANFADLSAVNGGLIVNGMSSETGRVAETVTWIGEGSDLWQTNGRDGNWVSSDSTFRAGDEVIFGDVVGGGFAGSIEILNAVSPSATTVDNDTQEYQITGLLSGSGPLTKTGTGTLRLQTSEGFFPLTGDIEVQGGVLELDGDSQGLTNASSLTVGAGATFRLAFGNTGQDNLPPLILSGGTFEVNDNYFSFPAGRTMTLAADTTSTIAGSAVLRPFAEPISGEGSLIKSGTGTLSVIGSLINGLAHTGTTTIEGGTILIGGANTTSSRVWNVSNGRLALEPDDAAPIANLPADTLISLSGGGNFDANNNTETISSLAMDSTNGRNLFIAQDGVSTLTTTDLVLTGTENQVIFIPNLGPDSSGTFPVMTATNLTGELGTNLTVFGVSPEAQTWSRDETTGLISVDIDLTANSAAITYTNASGAGVWSQGSLADWMTPEMPSTRFFNFQPTLLGDEPFAGPGELVLDIQDTVRPLATTFSNSAGNDYLITGLSISDSGSLTVNGGGQVTFDNDNFYTGETSIAGGSTLVLAAEAAISALSAITVEDGSTLEIEATNGLFRDDVTDAAVTLNGGTLLQSAGFHLNLNSVSLNSGAVWTATSPDSFDDENAQILGNVLVGGDSPSAIGPFTSGLGLAAEQTESGLDGNLFGVADVSASSAVDLTVSAQLENAVNVVGGVTKVGLGTMLMTGENIYGGATGVDGGTLLVSSALSIPRDGVGVVVFSSSQFGFVTSMMSDAEMVVIANNLVFDDFDSPEFGSLTFFVAEGETATFGGDLSGGSFASSGAGITVQGGGTLDFAGATLPVTPTATDGSTIIGVGNTVVEPATVISDFVIATEAGTTSGVQATLTFTADGAVDVYGSTDLESFIGVVFDAQPGSPVVLDNLAGEMQFFVLVSAGSTFPSEEG